MAEVAHAGEQHRQAVLVGGRDHFVVPHGAAGLNHRDRAGLGLILLTLIRLFERYLPKPPDKP